MSYIPKIYTVESVTSGHPDKMCDQVSDAILDECLRQDPKSRVAVETFGCHGHLIIGGEVTTRAVVNYEQIARQVYQQIGYEDELEIEVLISQQSPDIAQGVDTGGAGDQGIMYGYACDETPEFLPKGLVLAHQLTRGLEECRGRRFSSTKELMKIGWLKPDGKAQVTIENGEVKTLLVSCQHEENISQDKIRFGLIEKLIQPLIKDFSNIEILINPTGKFVQGGFKADTGLTGRKIMVDTYGGLIRHGGGCFSGKDLTKVDRSAAYMARFVAKNIVANGLAKECQVSVAYAIGRAEPVMLEARDERGRDLIKIINEKFDFRPRGIIERLGLRQPIYRQTASYGHFTNNNYPWEKIIDL